MDSVGHVFSPLTYDASITPANSGSVSLSDPLTVTPHSDPVFKYSRASTMSEVYVSATVVPHDPSRRSNMNDASPSAPPTAPDPDTDPASVTPPSPPAFLYALASSLKSVTSAPATVTGAVVATLTVKSASAAFAPQKYVTLPSRGSLMSSLSDSFAVTLTSPDTVWPAPHGYTAFTTPVTLTFMSLSAAMTANATFASIFIEDNPVEFPRKLTFASDSSSSLVLFNDGRAGTCVALMSPTMTIPEALPRTALRNIDNEIDTLARFNSTAPIVNDAVDTLTLTTSETQSYSRVPLASDISTPPAI